MWGGDGPGEAGGSRPRFFPLLEPCPLFPHVTSSPHPSPGRGWGGFLSGASIPWPCPKSGQAPVPSPVWPLPHI